MEFKDCKLGMKIKCLTDKHSQIDKGDIVTIEDLSLAKKRISIKDNIYTFAYYPEDFEPVSNFEIGEKVAWKDPLGYKYKCEIIFILEKEDDLKNKYLVKFEDEERLEYQLVAKKDLSKLLEINDIFEDIYGNKVEILAEEKESDGEIVYFCKNEDGYLDIRYGSEIKCEK